MFNKLYILIFFVAFGSVCFAQQEVPFQNSAMQNKTLQQNTTIESGAKKRLTKSEILANIAKQKEAEKKEITDNNKKTETEEDYRSKLLVPPVGMEKRPTNSIKLTPNK